MQKKSNFENYKQRLRLDNLWISHAMTDLSILEDIDYTFDYGYVFKEQDENEDLVDLDNTNSSMNKEVDREVDG